LYRKLTEEDIALLQEEIAKDPLHSQEKDFTPELFLDPRGQSVVFEDNEGVVMFVKFRREIEVTIQFRKDITPQRTREIFERYIPIFSAAFKNAGYWAVTYETTNKALAWFLRKFGFHKNEIQRKVL
jgi:hypothetical protein